MNNYVKDSIKSRQKYNREIITELSKLVENNPTLRFGQLLCNYVIPEKAEYIGIETLENCLYNEESGKTLARTCHLKHE